MQPTKLDVAFDALEKAEENSAAVWTPDEQPEDEFQLHIKSTAKTLLRSIEKSANGPYELEATDLAKLTKAVCELQGTFFGKDDKTSGNLIMTNQLALFKGML